MLCTATEVRGIGRHSATCRLRAEVRSCQQQIHTERPHPREMRASSSFHVVDMRNVSNDLREQLQTQQARTTSEHVLARRSRSTNLCSCRNAGTGRRCRTPAFARTAGCRAGALATQRREGGHKKKCAAKDLLVDQSLCGDSRNMQGREALENSKASTYSKESCCGCLFTQLVVEDVEFGTGMTSSGSLERVSSYFHHPTNSALHPIAMPFLSAFRHHLSQISPK